MNNMLIPGVVAFLLAIGTANAVDPPDVKEGLWSVHTESVDNPGNKKSSGTYTLCRDHAFDQSTRARASSMKGCSTVSQSFEAGKYSSAMHCVIGGTVVESKGTTIFQSDTSFHSETHGSYTPAMAGISETTMIMDQKFIGGCPAGILPGDRTNSDGTVIHLGKH